MIFLEEKNLLIRVMSSDQIICTQGSDGRLYYFRGGKRISTAVGRAQAPDIPCPPSGAKRVRKRKECREDQIRSPEPPYRCIKKSGQRARQLRKKGKLNYTLPTQMDRPPKRVRKRKECREDQIRSPVSNRCIKKSGQIARKLRKEGKLDYTLPTEIKRPSVRKPSKRPSSKKPSKRPSSKKPSKRPSKKPSKRAASVREVQKRLVDRYLRRKSEADADREILTFDPEMDQLLEQVEQMDLPTNITDPEMDQLLMELQNELAQDMADQEAATYLEEYNRLRGEGKSHSQAARILKDKMEAEKVHLPHQRPLPDFILQAEKPSLKPRPKKPKSKDRLAVEKMQNDAIVYRGRLREAINTLKGQNRLPRMVNYVDPEIVLDRLQTGDLNQSWKVFSRQRRAYQTRYARAVAEGRADSSHLKKEICRKYSLPVCLWVGAEMSNYSGSRALTEYLDQLGQLVSSLETLVRNSPPPSEDGDAVSETELEGWEDAFDEDEYSDQSDIPTKDVLDSGEELFSDQSSVDEESVDEESVRDEESSDQESENQESVRDEESSDQSSEDEDLFD